MYISRALKSHEKSYHIYELEILALVWAIGVFKHYLFKPFQVWTDNKAMTWLKAKRDSPNKRIAQWIINLESYDFEINHRTSRQNANADGPTRFNVMPADTNYGEKVDLTCSLEDFDPEPSPGEHYEHFEPDFGFSVNSEEQEELFLNSVQDAYSIPDLEDLIKEQKKDPQLAKIRDLLNKGEQTEDFPFLIEDGLVKRRTPNPHKFKRKVSKKFKFCHQIVVPDNKEIRQGIFSLYHNHLISAHNGSAKVIQLLQENFYWKNMATDFKRYVKACLFCAKRKTPRPLKQGLTQSLEAKFVMHKFAFDIVTGLPESSARGYKHILTGIDMFSRYPFAVPLADRSMKSVVQALSKIFYVFGFPKILISDLEPSFVSETLKRLVNKFGSRKAGTTGYQPQANASIERYHRWLNAVLTMFCNKQKTDWDEFLDGVLYAYRTSICVTTGFTPFEVMFGRRHRDFSDFLYRATDEDEEREKQHFIYDTKTLKEVYKSVKENQRKMMLANKAYRDKHRIDVRFQPNDLVLVWDPSADKEGPKKFQFAWSGPAKIVRRSGTSPRSTLSTLNQISLQPRKI